VLDTTSLSPVDAHVVDVSLVVVSHNNGAEIDECLAHLAPLGCPVVVVDAASTDATAEHVRERFPEVRVVELGTNEGYGAAANRGVELTATPFVLVLNADAWPIPGAVRALRAAANEASSLGVVGPRLVYPDGSEQRSVFGYPLGALSLGALVAVPGALDRLYSLLQRLRSRKGDRFTLQLVGDSEFVSGAALLFRRQALLDVGGFDAEFFMYCEEIDLCRRLRAAGWQVAFHDDATFVHVGGASTSQASDRMYAEFVRSYLRLIAKHRGTKASDRARDTAVAVLAVRSVLSHTDGRRRARTALTRLRSEPERP
jgi:GT2 family glycosyltransferase